MNASLKEVQPLAKKTIYKGEVEMSNTTKPEMQEVESSCIAAVSVNPNDWTMDIKFKSGKIYRYFDVHTHISDTFLSAGSHGKFFQKNIKGRYIYAILDNDGDVETYGKALILDKIRDALDELVNSSENYKEIIESGESAEINGFDFLDMAKDEIESSSNALSELLGQLGIALAYEGITDMYSYIGRQVNLNAYEIEYLEEVDL